MKRWTSSASILLGLVAVAAAAWWLKRAPSGNTEPDQRPPYVLPVTLSEVVRGDLQPVARLTGSVRAPARASLAFRAEGLLTEILVREAEVFAAGRALAHLASTEVELELASARAGEALAQRNLEKLEAGVRAEEKQRLAARLEAARAQARLAQLEVERAEKLPSERFMSQAELDRLRTAHAAAAADARAMESELAAADAGTREEDLAIAGAELDLARSRVALAEENLAKATLPAPFDGVVQSRLHSVGDWLDRGQAVLEVVNLGLLEVDVEIPGRVAPLLDAGAAVRITVDELPGLELLTQLDALVPAAEELSRNFRGIVRLDSAAAGVERLRPGMFVRLEIELAVNADALLVPSDALRETDEGPILVRAVPGDGPESWVAEWLPVRLLGERDGRTAVEARVDSLSAGDRVVVLGVDLAFPGAPLLPRKQDAAEREPDSAAGSH